VNLTYFEVIKSAHKQWMHVHGVCHGCSSCLSQIYSLYITLAGLSDPQPSNASIDHVLNHRAKVASKDVSFHIRRRHASSSNHSSVMLSIARDLLSRCTCTKNKKPCLHLGIADIGKVENQHENIRRVMTREIRRITNSQFLECSVLDQLVLFLVVLH
jgi:hypothetical protein